MVLANPAKMVGFALLCGSTKGFQEFVCIRALLEMTSEVDHSTLWVWIWTQLFSFTHLLNGLKAKWDTDPTAI